MKTLSPSCPRCQCAEFELRVLRDEAVAAARCVRCSADYLLLDSEDYWYDVIQKGYPRLTRCSCKNASFRIQIEYNIRPDGDVEYIEVHSICSTCGKKRRQLKFEVDYCNTDHLLEKPLVPCKNPKILYDLKDLNLLLLLPDIFRIIDRLSDEKCDFLANLRIGESWSLVRQEVAAVKTTIEKSRYLFIYAIPNQIEVSVDQIKGRKEEDAFWKRSEVIRISSKTHVCTGVTGVAHADSGRLGKGGC